MSHQGGTAVQNAAPPSDKREPAPLPGIPRESTPSPEDPALAPPRQVGAVSANDASEQTFDPLRRLRPLHGTRLRRSPNAAGASRWQESFSANQLDPGP